MVRCMPACFEGQVDRGGALLPYGGAAGCLCRSHYETDAPPVACLQDIVVPEQYPFQPVKMKFLTRVYHPNVSSATGAICLDILKDKWLPTLTLHSTLVSLQSLLCSPEPDDPQDAQVASHFKRDRADFDRTAKAWTLQYADPSNHAQGELTDDQRIRQAGLEKEHVDEFTAMGFAPKDVIRVLDRLNYRGSKCVGLSLSLFSHSLVMPDARTIGNTDSPPAQCSQCVQRCRGQFTARHGGVISCGAVWTADCVERRTYLPRFHAPAYAMTCIET